MNLKKLAAERAVTFIEGNTIVGLGDGSTIAYMVENLKLINHAPLIFFTSSLSTKTLLENADFNIGDIASVNSLDIYFDGCDQFDKNLNALKSGSGIHTTEKIFASMAKQFILVGDKSKYVDVLQTKFPLVIEVITDAVNYIIHSVKAIFPGSTLQTRTNKTRYGNILIDIWFEEFPDLAELNLTLKNITGVVETSLFYNMATSAIVAAENGTTIIKK